MARKLPWAAISSPDAVKPRSRQAVSTAVDREVKQDAARPDLPDLTSRKTRRARVSPRSPSTSPIRAPDQPIPQVEAMRPGLSQDDIYMMVEDEFESVARAFTAHLHAAEYARLKAKAKSLPARALPSPKSSMSRTTAQGLERKRLLSRQGTALDGLKSRSHEDDEDNDEDEVIENPWSGTSLATLMDGGERNKTSLMGLERLATGTRAAQGFDRANSFVEDITARKRTAKDAFDIDDFGPELLGTAVNNKDDKVKVHDKRQEPSGHKTKTTHTTRRAMMAQSTPSTSARRPPAPDTHTHDTDPKRTPAMRDYTLSKPTPNPTSKSRPTITSTKPSPRPPRRSRIIDLDEFDDEVDPDPDPETKSATKRTVVKTQAKDLKDRGRDKDRDRDTEKRQGRKRRLDEVPVFLI